MSLYFALLIILFSGIGGGLTNALLASRSKAKLPTGLQILESMAIGTGAAIVMPLFLHFAHSDILSGIHWGWDFCSDHPNIYLLFLAYSFLAATAGRQFIGNLVKNALNVKKIKILELDLQETAKTVKEQNLFIAEIVEEKEIKDKVIKQNVEKEKRMNEEDSLLAEEEENEKLLRYNDMLDPAERQKLQLNLDMKLGAINPGDRQKGRFGGKQENNGRIMTASISSKDTNGLFHVTVNVKSTDPLNELVGYVIFFLHDSFRPAARIEEVSNKSAELRNLLSIGTYTIGAIADNGDTFLEYDLSESPDATEEFKSI